MTAALMVLAAAPGLAADGAAKLADARSSLEKWVETRQLISRTRTDWQSDKEMIDQSTRMIERELKSVEDLFSKLTTNSTQVDKERVEAEALIKASNDALAPAAAFATDFEGKVRAAVPQLPLPLQDILKPLLARMPADPATTKMKAPERVQVLVGVLNEIDKFNNAVTIFSEKRKNDSGGEVSVETVYVGLGAAYFVNEAGDFAGAGTPGKAGWDWKTMPELADRVREIIRIYRAERPAKFISLPVAIK